MENSKDLSYEDKILEIDDFIFEKALSNGEGEEARLLDGALFKEFKTLKNMEDKEKIDELYDYITNNTDEALNELNLFEKISNLTGNKDGISFIKKHYETLLEDERVDNIFEEDLSEAETEELISDEEELNIEIEPVIERKHGNVREFFSKLVNESEEKPDDFLGEEIDEELYIESQDEDPVIIEDSSLLEEEMDELKNSTESDEEELNIEIEPVIERKHSKIGNFFRNLFKRNKNKKENSNVGNSEISEIISKMRDEYSDEDEEEINENIYDEEETKENIYDEFIEETKEEKTNINEREIRDYIYNNYTFDDIINSLKETKENKKKLKEKLIDAELKLMVVKDDKKEKIEKEIDKIKEQFEDEQIKYDSYRLKLNLFEEEHEIKYDEYIEKENQTKEENEEEKTKSINKKLEDEKYIEFWENVEDKELSSIQSSTDEEIKELYKASKEDTLLGKVAKKAIEESILDSNKKEAKKLGIKVYTLKKVREVLEESKTNLTKKGLENLIKTYKIEGQFKDELLDRNNIQKRK